MRIPARTPRATSTPVSSSPTQNTAVGQEAIEPSMPSPTGTVVLAASGRRRTNPASTSPMKAMNAPIPAAIAILSGSGMALNTAVRNPVRPRITMITPLTTTRPIASGQRDLRGDRHRDQGVDAQAGGHREREVGDEAEDDRHDARDQRGHRGDLRHRERHAEHVALRRRARGIEAAEDQRVEDHDVGHRHEGDEPTAHLAGRRRSRARSGGSSAAARRAG